MSRGQSSTAGTPPSSSVLQEIALCLYVDSLEVRFQPPLIWDKSLTSHIISCLSPGGPPADGGVM